MFELEEVSESFVYSVSNSPLNLVPPDWVDAVEDDAGETAVLRRRAQPHELDLFDDV